MQTGIIILNYNSNEELIFCVNSIKEHTKDDYHIYIVDNNSKEENKIELQSRYGKNADIELIFLNENLGYSGGNNQGVIKALSDGVEYILIVNPDVEFRNDVVGQLKKKICSSCPYVGPKIIDLDGNDGQRLRKNFTFKHVLFNKKPLYYLRNVFNADSLIKHTINEALVFKGSISGCCFMISADVMRNIGMFDDNVFLYCEEHIIGKKLEERNLNTKYVPEAVVLHKEGSSTKKISNSFIDYHMYASEYYLVCKYCTSDNIRKKMIKSDRIFLYFLKNLMKYHDWERFFALKKTMNNIYNMKYKIHY